MKSTLVTGIGGFVGHHLCHEIKNQGFRVVGTGRSEAIDPALNAVVDEYIGSCDLTDSTAVEKLPLERIDAVINLAGLAQVGASFDNAERYHDVNVRVHTTLAERIKTLTRRPRIISVSTGAVYDNNQPMPLTEASQLALQGSPYALSKIAMEHALQAYIEQGLDIVIVRPFNHIGPGQLSGFLVPDLAQQVIQSNHITVGNLETRRDYTDVRDVVRAYVTLATKPGLQFRLYNVCSGTSLRGQDILSSIITASGKSDIDVTVDPSRIRPNDPIEVVGDNTRLRQEIGWRPQIPLSQTIEDYFRDLTA